EIEEPKQEDLNQHYLKPNLSTLYIGPRNESEQVIVAIWEEMLGFKQIGVNDNFFELGGHSLLAIQLLNRINEIFKFQVPMHSLFEAPTVAGLATLIEQIRQKEKGISNLPPIAKVERNGHLPLSFAQQRLWFIDQLIPGSSAYNISNPLLLVGAINVEELIRTFTEIVHRHEVLRTVFKVVAGEPVQVIMPSNPIQFSKVDLSSIAESDRKALIDQLISEEARRPFDLQKDSLLRVGLLKLDEQLHILLITIHHIIADEWSIRILLQELISIYRALHNGEDSPLSELPIQYADFAIWQREWLQGNTLEEQISYWKRQLGDAPTVLPLPTDYPRPAEQTFLGATHFTMVPRDLFDQLKMFGHKHGATLFMVLLAVFQELLRRYSGQKDICVGSPIANRGRSEFEGLIGFFVNTLVLRGNLSGDPSFKELLVRTREVALAAYAHQDLPFEYIVEILKPERSLSHSPLFQVFFIFQDIVVEELRLGEAKLELFPFQSRTSKYDLTLSIADIQQNFILTFEYNTDLFELTTVQRILTHFQTLLKNIAAAPDRPLSSLLMLTSTEQIQLLVEWNATDQEYDREKTIHQLFENQVRRSPDAVALIYQEQQLTYSELNSSANQLANYLRSLGVGPEALVGIHIEPSVNMVIALLGILKAGGAYLPLDPKYPKERLLFMLEDANVSLILTEYKLAGELPDHKTKAICLDTEWETFSKIDLSNPDNSASGDNLAYVIYTSGSTGRPKGVQITHGSVVNLLLSMSKQPGLDDKDTLMAVTSLSFDIAVLELCLPLIVGAKLVVISRESVLDTSKLLEKLERYGVTAMQATPTTWQLLIEYGMPQKRPFKALCGGEALSLKLALQLYERTDSVWNVYGPTETTIWSTVAKYQPSQRVPSIGGPVFNTKMFILDTYLQPVPVGVVGELFIGGDGLARGYLNHPQLSAEKFIPNPFSNEPGARLYRTGDLGRYLEDGNIEFLGRIDN
ncbi:MAG: amino acid adenylation domain-containing protein, partial [Acidobacteriota bacterium]